MAPGEDGAPSAGVYPNIPQAILLLLAIIVLQLVLGVVLGVAGAIAGALLGVDPMALTCLVSAVGTFVACGLVVAWGLWRTRRPWREVFPLKRFRLILLPPLAVFIVGAGIACSEWSNVVQWLVPKPAFLDELLAGITRGGGWALFLLTVAAPITEELVFRGLILGGLLTHYGARKAILVSALLFAVFHLNPYQLGSALVQGLVLGWLFWRTRSLLLCMVAHALVNAHVWIILNLFDLRIAGYTLDTEALGQAGGPPFQPLWFTVLGLVLAAAGLVALAAVLPRPPRQSDAAASPPGQPG